MAVLSFVEDNERKQENRTDGREGAAKMKMACLVLTDSTVLFGPLESSSKPR